MAKKSPVKIPTVAELFEAGVHFGHPSRRWHPAMKGFIFSKVRGVHILDLEKTEEKLGEACQVLYEIAKRGGNVVFVGLRRQSAGVVEEEARRVGAMFMAGRWVGGLLTNLSEIKKNIAKLGKLEAGLSSGEFAHYTKKERLKIEREVVRLNNLVGGIKDLSSLPDALFLASARRSNTAVREAKRMGVPVVAVVDSNTDPGPIDYPIPGNDDSLKSLRVLVGAVADAIEAGYKGKGAGEGEATVAVAEGQSLEGLGLETRTKNALERVGITDIATLKGMSREELLGVKGVGKKAVEGIEKRLISK